MRVEVRRDYQAFLRSKGVPGVRYEGDFAIIPDRDQISPRGKGEQVAPHLHEYQRFAVAFAVARKRAALFMECGLGKTSIALTWAQIVRGDQPALICAPLAACHEFENERDRFFVGMPLEFVRTSDIDEWLASPTGIAVCTHHAFREPRELSRVGAIVLDESSILKSGDGAIATNLTASAKTVPYRLCLSATPAPNDPVEYAAHATHLGYVRSDAEFRARFFVRDGKFWRVKGHAERELPRWLARWALWMRDPSAYGMPCDALPADHPGFRVVDVAASDVDIPRDLLGVPLAGMSMSDRCAVRRSLYDDDERLDAAVRLVSAEPSIVWAIRNDHANALERAIRASGRRVAQIAGVTPDEDRVRIVRAFQAGELDVIVSKPRVIGHGVNLQRADVMVFAGYDESYEAHHQAVRRAHRQGRAGNLAVYVIQAPEERRVVQTLNSKRAEWLTMADRMQAAFVDALGMDIQAYHEGTMLQVADETHERLPVETDDKHFMLIHGDCIPAMNEDMAANSVDMAVFSPPFSALFTYSSEREDMGNCSEHDDVEFSIHFAHFADALLRVMKPGRVCALHLQQIVAFRARHGRKGLRDFRGEVIRRMEESGWHYYGEFVIPKNPQAAAIRTKSERLQFAQFKRDSLESSPCLNDYVLEFRKPGKQERRVKNDVSNEEWIAWASGVWDDIRETDVLEGWTAGRAEEDEKHICPLQLEVIRRCIRLWSNPGEVVLTPFAGIGSEVYVAIEQHRFGLGVELKAEYFRQVALNARLSVQRHHMQGSLAL